MKNIFFQFRLLNYVHIHLTTNALEILYLYCRCCRFQNEQESVDEQSLIAKKVLQWRGGMLFLPEIMS